MNQTENETPSAGPQPTARTNRVWLWVGGLALLSLAAALLIFGGDLFRQDETDGALESIPPFGATAESGVAQTSGSGVVVLEAGVAAPDFDLQTLDGEALALADLAGKPLLINFWATWCAPCRLEMPELEAISRDYADTGLVVVGVNQEEASAQVQPFVDELDLSFPILMDLDGDMSDAYGAFLLPMSIFVNPQGQVTAVHRGILTRDLADEYLRATIPPFGA
jgi:peroxiredoxin